MTPAQGTSTRRKASPLFEIARLLVRLGHVASRIVNTNRIGRKRFVVRADEKVTAFVEVQAAICARRSLPPVAMESGTRRCPNQLSDLDKHRSFRLGNSGKPPPADLRRASGAMISPLAQDLAA
jgi:hypothetical protein